MFGSFTHICARWMGKHYRNRNGTTGKNTSKPVKSIAEHGETTPYTGILMETWIWPIREKVEYQTLMMYFSLINSDDK